MYDHSVSAWVMFCLGDDCFFLGFYTEFIALVRERRHAYLCLVCMYVLFVFQLAVQKCMYRGLAYRGLRYEGCGLSGPVCVCSIDMYVCLYVCMCFWPSNVHACMHVFTHRMYVLYRNVCVFVAMYVGIRVVVVRVSVLIYMRVYTQNIRYI
jgi:hypothetical protein